MSMREVGSITGNDRYPGYLTKEGCSGWFSTAGRNNNAERWSGFLS